MLNTLDVWLNTFDVCRNNPAQPEIRVMWKQKIWKCVTVLGRTVRVCFATNVGFSPARSLFVSFLRLYVYSVLQNPIICRQTEH